jgi:hypothetical protein
MQRSETNASVEDLTTERRTSDALRYLLFSQRSLNIGLQSLVKFWLTLNARQCRHSLKYVLTILSNDTMNRMD